MSSDLTVPAHNQRRSIVPCEGAGETGETIETESSDLQAATMPADAAPAQTTTLDEQSSQLPKEIAMSEKFAIDLQRLEALAAEGLSQKVIAERFGIPKKTLANKIYNHAEVKAAWDRGRASYLASNPTATAPQRTPRQSSAKKKTSAKKSTRAKKAATGTVEMVGAAAESRKEATASPAVAGGAETKSQHRALQGAVVELQFMAFHGEPSSKHEDVMEQLYAAIRD
jgi:hypothetical protein